MTGQSPRPSSPGLTRRSSVKLICNTFLLFRVLFLAARKVPKEPRPAAWPSAALAQRIFRRENELAPLSARLRQHFRFSRKILLTRLRRKGRGFTNDVRPTERERVVQENVCRNSSPELLEFKKLPETIHGIFFPEKNEKRDNLPIGTKSRNRSKPKQEPPAIQ